MALFTSTLESTVAVAFFVPGIVFLADAISTQTEAAAVRGLSLTYGPLRQLIWGELRTGVLKGLTLAAIALPGVWLVIGELPLAIAVAGALLRHSIELSAREQRPCDTGRRHGSVQSMQAAWFGCCVTFGPLEWAGRHLSASAHVSIVRYMDEIYGLQADGAANPRQRPAAAAIAPLAPTHPLR